MKKQIKGKKGITLIALVITIIVLLILAGVTIATLTGDNGLLTKSGNARNTNIEAENMEKIKLAYQDYYLGQHTQSGYTFKNALDKMFGENIAQVTGERPWTITIRDKTYSLESNGTVTPNTSGQEGSGTSLSYEVGDVVRLGGEDFYVIEESDVTKTTVKLLAKYNVKTTTGEGQYTQTASANTLRFDDDSKDYATSEIKSHVDAYKTVLEGKIRKAVQEARLMTKEEVEAFGGDFSSVSTSECPAFINEQNYWIYFPDEKMSNIGWYVMGSTRRFANISVNYENAFGLRPVVILLKSNI